MSLSVLKERNQVLLQFMLLSVAFAILIFGAEVLVRGAVGLARLLGLSPFFIGLTIVGFGTSSPELATGIVAALRGNADINVGNVVGSNIQNIALILGVAALVSPIPVRLAMVRREALAFAGVAFVPLLTIPLGHVLPRWLGFVMLSALALYLHRSYRHGRAGAEDLGADPERIDKAMHQPRSGQRRRIVRHGACVVAGLIMLVIGSRVLVDSATSIAQALGVSDLVIGLTVVAFGTSAPELVTSVVAAVRKQTEISMGNILGSNILNVLFVLGCTSMIRPLPISRQVLMLDTPVMIAFSLACLPMMITDQRIDRKEGALLLAGLVLYVVVLFTWAPAWFGA
jgi:cation:H+ antiporter